MKLNPRIKKVQPLADFQLRLTFTNGEIRIYDVRPLVARGGVFRELQDASAFRSVRPRYGTVQWSGGQDICPDTLYEDSVPERALAILREKPTRYAPKKPPTKKKRKS